MNLNDANAYINLGVLLAEDETRRDKAYENFRKEIEVDPHNANAYFISAGFRALYGSEADKDEIFECLQKCVNLDLSFIEKVKLFAEIEWIGGDAQFAEITGQKDGE